MDTEAQRLTISQLEEIFQNLRREGYRLIGPKLRNQAILYEEIESTGDLPQGWTEE